MFWHPPTARFRHAQLRATHARRVLATGVYSGFVRKSVTSRSYSTPEQQKYSSLYCVVDPLDRQILALSVHSTPSQRPPRLWRVPLTRTLVLVDLVHLKGLVDLLALVELAGLLDLIDVVDLSDVIDLVNLVGLIDSADLFDLFDLIDLSDLVDLIDLTDLFGRINLIDLIEVID